MKKRSSRLAIVVTARGDRQFGRLLIVGAVILAASVATPVWAQHPAPTGRQEKPDTTPEARRPLRQEPDDADRVAGDGRRTLARLPQNVARGIGGVFSLDSLLPVLVGLAATGAARGFDDHVAFPDGANSDFGELGNGFGNPVFVAAAATGLLLGGRAASAGRFRDASYDLFTATAVNLLYTEALKMTIDRTRPNGADNKSFPSGHTSNAFTWATVIDHHFGKKLGLPMYAFAPWWRDHASTVAVTSSATSSPVPRWGSSPVDRSFAPRVSLWASVVGPWFRLSALGASAAW